MTAGGGVTYPRVVELLTAEVTKKGQRGAARDIKIALLSLQRYIKGIGEPSQATLEKLSAYFGVSVEWLRGGRNIIDTYWLSEPARSVAEKEWDDGQEALKIKYADLIKLFVDTVSIEDRGELWMVISEEMSNH